MVVVLAAAHQVVVEHPRIFNMIPIKCIRSYQKRFIVGNYYDCITFNSDEIEVREGTRYFYFLRKVSPEYNASTYFDISKIDKLKIFL